MVKKEARLHLQEVRNAIVRKQEKSKNYKTFTHNGLYIFTHHANWSEGILTTFFKECKEILSYYQFYMINSIDRLYIYHVQEDALQVFPLSNTKLKSIHWKSLQYEQRQGN